MSDSRMRMARLAVTFPAVELRFKRGDLSAWLTQADTSQGLEYVFDASSLAEWYRTGDYGHGLGCVARFLLFVWNPDGRWEGIKPFDLAEALACWDEGQKGAFADWARQAWWA